MSLVDQFHQSKSVILDGSKPGKKYFFEYPVADLLAQGLVAFEKNIILYNKLVDQKKYGIRSANGEQAFDRKVQVIQASKLQELKGDNKRVNEIFNAPQESAFIAANQGFWFDKDKSISALELKIFIAFLKKLR